jgi:SAM-dependent methyltransferase
MDSCFCGNAQTEIFKQSSFHIDESGTSLPIYIEYVRCTKCGTVRPSKLPFSSESEYEEYYKKYPPTMESYKAKDWEHDLRLAKMRYDYYEIPFSSEVLDVGSGSGAFVYECLQRGNKAYGCELADYHYSKQKDNIYKRKFEDIHFITDSYDYVTLFDVLEHTINPISMIKEMYRITKQEGFCLIDYPRFFHSTGQHHWKDTQHIWMIPEESLIEICDSIGFDIYKIDHPIESKITLQLQKPIEKRKSVLIPPGIGDSYWSIIKMQSWMEHEKLDVVDVTLVSDKEHKYQGHLRSIPFLRMFPFINATGTAIANAPSAKKVWNEAYVLQGRTVFKNVLGYDYFICYNGHIRVGKQLDQLDPMYKCNWYPPMFVSLEQEIYKQQCTDTYGKYFVCYFPFYGTYGYWTKEFAVSEVIATINKVQEDTGMMPIIVGAGWDADDITIKKVINNLNCCVNLTGKTTLDELFGLLKGAEVVIGYPSGLTIIAAVFGVKTLIIWNKYYNRDFWWNTVPPDTHFKTYFVENTENLTSTKLINEIKDLISVGYVSESCQRIVPIKASSDITNVKENRVIMVPSRSKLPPVSRRGNNIYVVQPGTIISSPAPAYVARDEEKATVTVVCVYKSGGDFNLDYVVRLRNMVARYSTIPYQFICLTDVKIDPNVCKSIQLDLGYNGWWNKLQLFKNGIFNTNRIIYFDLDTVILNNIDEILTLETDFAGLGDWFPGPRRNIKENFGSGLMAWKNHRDFSFIFSGYDKTAKYIHGDQRYIVDKLLENDVKYDTLQDLVSGIYSYKRNCLKQLPNDVRVICFHGQPRPHQIVDKVKFIRNFWR